MELTELLKTAANPHLIASASKANELLMLLQGHISDLRLEISELELKSDLHLNELLKEGTAIERAKSTWRVSDIYREHKTKAGLLTDVRAVRRNLERHTDLLMQQERYQPRTGNYPRAI